MNSFIFSNRNLFEFNLKIPLNLKITYSEEIFKG